MRLPEWVSDPNLTPDARRSAMLNYRIRLAALHQNPTGSVRELSFASGCAKNYLHVVLSRGEISRKVALAVESVIADPSIFAASMFD